MRSRNNKTSYKGALLLYNINISDNNQSMTSKRSIAALCLSTGEIPLVNLSNAPTSSQDENKTNYKDFDYLEFDKLIKLYSTVPVTTATAELEFSALNRLKTTL
ncbi:hypothetical protein I4U23_026120 [Adineta vaga]|nr:hypothetical protein I4U23_026120 [Adineta vaga]